MQNDHEQDMGIQRIRRSLRSVREAQIYITFATLGVGDALEAEPLALKELASRIAVDSEGLRRFAAAAQAFGILETSDSVVSLTELGRDVFTTAGQHSMVHILKLEGAFLERWGRLAEAVRIGGRPEENRAQEDAPDWVRMFTLALYQSSFRPADVVARAINAAFPQETEGRLRVIDVGGGHGAYSMSLVRLREDVDATVFDLPQVVAVTDGIVAEAGLAGRVITLAGDFHHDPMGTDFDLALLFGVLHGETPDGAERLLQSLHGAIRPGGLLLIRSRGGRSGSGEPGEREITDLHMLLSTSGGQAKASEDVTSLVTRYGFTFQGEQEIEQPVGGTLLVFRRGDGAESREH